MQSFFQNKYVKAIGAVLAVIAALVVLIIIYGAFNLISGSTSLQGTGYGGSFAPSMDYGVSAEKVERGMVANDLIAESAPYIPSPTPSTYTADLEKYETTQYSVTARTKEFDALCSTLEILKTADDVHFKNLNTSTNNCRATFYVEEEKAPEVLETFKNFADTEINGYTSSCHPTQTTD